MPLVFDMDTDDSTVSVVTMKRKPVGITAKVIFKGSGPVADPKVACTELSLTDFAVVETTDDHKRARAVLVALSNGSTAAVLVPPSLEKAAVKKAYTADQGSTKVLVPWTKLAAMEGAAWLGPHMTISEALQEHTKPKPRPTAKVAETPALPTVEVPAASPVKPTKKPRKVAPTPITPEHVSETESEDDLCSTQDEDNDDDDEEEDADSDEAIDTDDAEEEEEVQETDPETEADTESEEEAPSPARKRQRIFDVTAVCSDEMETRKITARFEVHGQEEMNRVFESFRKGGLV